MPLPRELSPNLAVRAIVAELGSQAAAIRAIGIPRGTFYDHFSSYDRVPSTATMEAIDATFDGLDQDAQDRVQLLMGLMAERGAAAQMRAATRLAQDDELRANLEDTAARFVLERGLSLEEWARYQVA